MSISPTMSAMMLIPEETPVPAPHPIVTFHHSICNREARDHPGRGRNRDRHLPTRPAMGERPLDAINERLMSAVNVSDLIEAFYYLSHGANVNCCLRDRTTPLYVASSNGYLDLMHLLLSQRGMLINMPCAHQETALYRAVANQQVNAARMLLLHGADVNARDAFDRTPLHAAVAMNNLYMVELLLAHGAPANARDCFGDTPVHFATLQPVDVNILRMLMENGAEPNARGPCGNTVLHLVAHGPTTRRQVYVMNMLIHYGADVNATATMSKRTPLHAAAMVNNDEVIRLLLKAGADINAKNCVGKTPGAIAQQFNSVAAAELLEEALLLETKIQAAETVNVAEELEALSLPSQSTWRSRFKQRMTRWNKHVSSFKQCMGQFKLNLQRLSPTYCYYW